MQGAPSVAMVYFEFFSLARSLVHSLSLSLSLCIQGSVLAVLTWDVMRMKLENGKHCKYWKGRIVVGIVVENLRLPDRLLFARY